MNSQETETLANASSHTHWLLPTQLLKWATKLQVQEERKIGSGLLPSCRHHQQSKNANLILNVFPYFNKYINCSSVFPQYKTLKQTQTLKQVHNQMINTCKKL